MTSKCGKNKKVSLTGVICGPFPILTNTKVAIWRHLLSIQKEANGLVAMRSKEYCDWFREIKSLVV